MNMVPSKSVEKTPYEIWTRKRPGLSFLKVWGCEAYVKRLMSDKLTPKSDKCFFVGYPRETKGYYFYNKAEGKVFVARNGVFLEKEFLSKGLVRARCNLKKFRKRPKLFQYPLKIHGMCKMLHNP
jgi:hypothetical protein